VSPDLLHAPAEPDTRERTVSDRFAEKAAPTEPLDQESTARIVNVLDEARKQYSESPTPNKRLQHASQQRAALGDPAIDLSSPPILQNPRDIVSKDDLNEVTPRLPPLKALEIVHVDERRKEPLAVLPLEP
jgi:hypothetical protein